MDGKTKTPKLRCIEMEEAIARFFGVRQHIIIPNASWGMGLHECDLLIIRPTGFCIEVEIKTTIADLKKDFEKRHGHISDKIKEFYYAVPGYIYEKALPLIPTSVGIIAVSSDPETEYSYAKIRARIRRTTVINKRARPLTEKEIFNAARLGCMRIWSLKVKLITAHKQLTISKTG